MDFVDFTLVRLAADDTRATVLTSDALFEVVAAAYDLEAMSISGPYGGQFDDFMLGYAPAPVTTLDGGWGVVGATDRTDAQFRLSGFGPRPDRIDALWRGAVVARTVAAVDRVESVVSGWSGPVPDSEYRGAVEVAYGESATGPATPTPLPVAVAMLIRDAGFSVAELVAGSQSLRRRLLPLGLERPADPALKLRHPIVIAWLVPAVVFDDDGWPGAAGGTAAEKREARRAAAAAWLARDGIGLLAIG